jgi:hypothetical protein
MGRGAGYAHSSRSRSRSPSRRRYSRERARSSSSSEATNPGRPPPTASPSRHRSLSNPTWMRQRGRKEADDRSDRGRTLGRYPPKKPTQHRDDKTAHHSRWKSGSGRRQSPLRSSTTPERDEAHSLPRRAYTTSAASRTDFLAKVGEPRKRALTGTYLQNSTQYRPSSRNREPGSSEGSSSPPPKTSKSQFQTLVQRISKERAQQSLAAQVTTSVSTLSERRGRPIPPVNTTPAGGAAAVFHAPSGSATPGSAAPVPAMFTRAHGIADTIPSSDSEASLLSPTGLFAQRETNDEELLAMFVQREKEAKAGGSSGVPRQVLLDAVTKYPHWDGDRPEWGWGSKDIGGSNQDCVLAAFRSVKGQKAEESAVSSLATSTDQGIRTVARIYEMREITIETLRRELPRIRPSEIEKYMAPSKHTRAFVQAPAMDNKRGSYHAYAAIGIDRDSRKVIAWDPDASHLNLKLIPQSLIEMIFI